MSRKDIEAKRAELIQLEAERRRTVSAAGRTNFCRECVELADRVAELRARVKVLEDINRTVSGVNKLLDQDAAALQARVKALEGLCREVARTMGYAGLPLDFYDRLLAAGRGEEIGGAAL